METWRDIPEYVGFYQASSTGKIRSLPRTTTRGKVLKQYVNEHNGYCYVTLSKHNVRRSRRVHVLIALAFLGAPNGLQVNHKDGDKTNNSIGNLEYCTQSENMRHAYETGLEVPKGIPVIDLDTGKIYISASEAARDISGGVAQGEMVARVCRGERSHYRERRFAFLSDYENGTIPEFKGRCKKKGSKSLWR